MEEVLVLTLKMHNSKAQFEKLVAEAIDNMPERFQKRINNLAFFVEDRPTEEQLGKIEHSKENDYELLGLYEGYHQSKRLNSGPVLPDRITLFKKPIESFCRTEKELKERITKTVYHEIAHHFGSDEEGASRHG